MTWFERLFENAISANVAMATDSSLVVRLEYATPQCCADAKVWWVASFGLGSTASPKHITDSSDVAAIIAFCRHVLRLSKTRHILTRQACILAAFETVNTGSTFTHAIFSIVLDAPDIRLIKRTYSAAISMWDTGGEEYI